MRTIGQGIAVLANPPSYLPRDGERAVARLLETAGLLALPLSSHFLGGEPRDVVAFRFDRPAADREAAARSLAGMRLSLSPGGA
ncbi:MAG: hypothetical protein FJX53_14985 [Alphaproteobacteria bacterium]|nr:hypothetical protein [Alphaproteobacteria bacterium]